MEPQLIRRIKQRVSQWIVSVFHCCSPMDTNHFDVGTPYDVFLGKGHSVVYLLDITCDIKEADHAIWPQTGLGISYKIFPIKVGTGAQLKKFRCIPLKSILLITVSSIYEYYLLQQNIFFMSSLLTEWSWDRMFDIFQMTFPNYFYCMKIFPGWFGFHYNLFPRTPFIENVSNHLLKAQVADSMTASVITTR